VTVAKLSIPNSNPFEMHYNKTVKQMQMTTKTKRVSVTPLSSKAKNRFANNMELFHTCVVEQEKLISGVPHIFLVSLNKQYCFWVPEKGNEHWKIEK
jgi:hypothetical protein